MQVAERVESLSNLSFLGTVSNNLDKVLVPLPYLHWKQWYATVRYQALYIFPYKIISTLSQIYHGGFT